MQYSELITKLLDKNNDELFTNRTNKELLCWCTIFDTKYKIYTKTYSNESHINEINIDENRKIYISRMSSRCSNQLFRILRNVIDDKPNLLTIYYNQELDDIIAKPKFDQIDKMMKFENWRYYKGYVEYLYNVKVYHAILDDLKYLINL